MQHIRGIATDYDETVAEFGFVPPETLEAMERFRASGRLLILDTGRGLDDLATVFPEFARFDAIVAENGAVLWDGRTGSERLLADPLPHDFLDDLRRRGVSPVPKRSVIVDTRAVHKHKVLDAMRAASLDLHLVFNKESLLVLPKGVDKGSGLAHALSGTGVTLDQVAGIGDAENDHGLLDVCGLKVAVPNAVPAILQRAERIMTFRQLVDAVLIQ